MAVVDRVYAQSLLEAARENDRRARVREEFDDFMAAVQESAELRALLRSPQIEPRAKRDALEAVLGDADEIFRNFLLLVAEKNRIGGLEGIHEEFERLCAAEERVLRLEVTTAVALSEEEAEELSRRIEEATGGRVEITRRTDSSLIGGLVLQADSLRLDASVRGRLNQLRQELVTRS